ncbi:MAG: HIT family protein [Proteobacteria bacterium]|nr:HIT family protein [Pseudomonadota bacterium]
MAEQTFKLDSRLANDCIMVSESEQFCLLLMDNSLVSWFILVPKIDKTELYLLDEALQSQIFEKINLLSRILINDFKADKLNVASIGNIVEQLHIHVVGRYQSDPYWPGVVWGESKKKAYTAKEVKKIKIQLESILEL